MVTGALVGIIGCFAARFNGEWKKSTDAFWGRENQAMSNKSGL